MFTSKRFVSRFIVILLVFVVSRSKAFELHCVFEKAGWDNILSGAAFACRTININVSMPHQVITKLHPESNAKNVNAFLVLDQNLEYFPSGLFKFFGNLEGIAVQRSNLKMISKNDLRLFSNLRSISLYGNRLKVIENELFRYNPKLELISLFNNQLQQIFPSAFENLAHLQLLYLNSNPCINFDATDATKLEKLKCELVLKCKVTDAQRDFAIVESEKIKLEEENVKLHENFNAMNRNLAMTKRDLVRFQNGYERFGS